MPTAFEMKRKNEAFAKNAREGRSTTKPSRAELAARKAPVSGTVLGVLAFVLVGGILFELVRIIFLK
ncbi:hypothetical protein BKA62DRAFT_691606 [Auriculariales sp. MPI-PUGE-AT-0066]|nr:hypothetical protein BKA62DRAFT_691606 [Auriculariales sp. MPI-PUGE-AT-0066]